ncbi:MAG: inositol-3-phosphate synthase, partial [Calditrichaeota bacterium]
MGAVSTTFMAGVLSIRKGIGKPIGSLTQMGTIRLGKRTEHRVPLIKDFVPLADLNDLVFGGWDIFEENAYQSALNAGVLDRKDLLDVKDELEQIKPMPAVFDPEYVKKLHGTYVKKGKNKMDLAEQLREDIRNFKQENNLDRLIMVWCGSTEVYLEPHEVHQSLEKFEKAMVENHPAIAPSMIYAYASLKEGVPYA